MKRNIVLLLAAFGLSASLFNPCFAGKDSTSRTAVFTVASGGAISGPSVVTEDQSITIVNVELASGNCNSYEWELDNGKLLSIIAVQGGPEITVAPQPAGQIKITRLALCGFPLVGTGITITVLPRLKAGVISPETQAIAPGMDPGMLRGTIATGGNCPGGYLYHWEKKTDGSDWAEVGTGQNFDPGPLTMTTQFRRRVDCSVPGYSNEITVTIATLSVDMNYVREREINRPGMSDKGTADGLTDVNDVEQVTQYFDGLGRRIQTVTRQQSPLGKDMVAPQTYDAFGRETTHFLPYISPSADGNYKPYSVTEQNSFGGDQYPGEQLYYGRTDFEPSPLNRPLTNYAAGNNWIGNGQGVATSYQTNVPNGGNIFHPITGDNVRIWTISSQIGSLPSSSAVYSPGQLYKTVTTDEQSHQVIVYKDKDGQVVLKKVQGTGNVGQDHTGWLCTYYVYDDLDNLRFVIPPKAVEAISSAGWSVSQDIADELCFRYEYDALERMIVKKVPGAGEVWMVYDIMDRLVFTQDANQRQHDQWLSTQYDDLNRVRIIGMVNYVALREALQQLVTSQTAGDAVVLPADLYLTLPDMTGDFRASHSVTMDDGFSTLPEGSFNAEITATNEDPGTGVGGSATAGSPIPPGVTIQPLIINYYDNYDWVNETGSGLGRALATDHTTDGNYFLTSYNSAPAYAAPVTADLSVRGQLTGTMRLVLGENRPLYAVNFYDDRARLIQTRSMNYAGGVDTVTNQYDFHGKMLRHLLTHYKAGHTAQYHTVLTKMDYDAAERVKNIWKNVDGAATDQLISDLQYDELGQLKTKVLGNDLDNVVNEYNIRGWLTGINKGYLQDTAKHYFGMELAYDKTVGAVPGVSYAKAALNGNITGTIWKSAGDGVNRKYDFSYDNVNRLVAADFNQQFAGGWGKSDPGGSGAAMDYSVSNISYDANGNMGSMQQNGFKVGAPTDPVDQLTYNYQPNSNKLLQVIEGHNDPDSRLGDFHFSGTQQSGTGYNYDLNGNLTVDNNKGIDQITYNYLNLPELVHVTGKGSIRYTYDAAGKKMQKVTTDDLSGTTTTTLYMENFQYQRRVPTVSPDAGVDTLLFIGHEEGRARWAFHKYLNGQTGYGWEYDFFEKDHLGNTRVLLTQQQDTAKYIATMEDQYRNTEKALFYSLDTSIVDRADAGYPNDVTMTDPNNKVTVLNGSGIKQGPAIILKVMSGDKIDLSVRYFYNNAGSTTNISLSANDLLGGLANGLLGITGGTHGVMKDLVNPSASPLVGAINGFFNDPAIPAEAGKPRAYLNWMLLDNQFRYVSGNEQSGALQVGEGGTDNGQLREPLAKTCLPITTSGYLYIYLSNETEHQDVYFDDLSVVHYSGPMLEEDHYYPFGLTMAGISDKAMKGNYSENKYRYNGGSELQNMEFADGSGLETYDTYFRMLDPQIGRWWQLDPVVDGYENISPYASMYDDPEKYNDPLGNEGEEANACCKVLKQILAGTAAAVTGIIDNAAGTNIRGSVAASGIIEDEDAAQVWNNTSDAIDVLSYVAGEGESGAGGAVLTGSIAVTGATGGLSIEVSGPAAVVGGLMMVHGQMVAHNAIKSLMTGSAHVQIHGNDLNSQKPQHGYEIKDHQSGDVHKYGVSGEKLNKNGSSPRANKQVNELNKGTPAGQKPRYSARVVKKNVPARKKIINWEKGKVNGFINKAGKKPKGNKRP